jgi:uncharacterized protein
MSLNYSSVVDAPLDDTFAWHERPGAIVRLTPPWTPMRIIKESPSLQDGQAVLRFPAGIRWVAQHSDYDPPHSFVDSLTSLPLHWRHTHAFSAEDDSHTRVTDTVDTPVPARFLRQMFHYRHDILARDLLTHAEMAAHIQKTNRNRPFTVAVTGSTGLVGRSLCALLTTGGHQVRRLVRGTPGSPDEVHWDPERPDPDLLAGVDAVAHLAGAPIGGRFTPAHKRAIYGSRVGPTRKLAELIAQSTDGPSAFVVASAIGFYGPNGTDHELTEDSARGDGFLAGLVSDWEAAADPAREAHARVVTVRTGIVQSPLGGVLRLMRPLFTAGLGGRLGNGQQWFSWVDLDDITDMYYRALVDSSMNGPINAVAPNPVRNREFAAILAHVLSRPALLPTPALGPRALLGTEGANELALASQRVVPATLTTAGFRFRQPDLEGCLRHQLGRVRL